MFQFQIRNSQSAHSFLKDRFSVDQEEFWVLALGSELQVLDCKMLFRGTVHSCPVHPRDVIRFVAGANATSFMIAHNHPEGQALPSRSDLAVTRQLWKVGGLIEIPLTDHLILGKEGYCSLADRGFFLKMSLKGAV
ncbi:MAG: JAB domain-containing protein [Bdellovibrionaceae bacterium]|nr:JAB domain-containing protein [Pseudobdellovibrionaceae bacterium]